MKETSHMDGYASDPWAVFSRQGERSKTSKPIWMVPCGADSGDELGAALGDDVAARWLNAVGFKAKAGRFALVPDGEGDLKGVAFGLGGDDTGRPCGPGELLMGSLPLALPAGGYHLAEGVKSAELAAIAWGLGAYRFDRYKSAGGSERPKLEIPESVDAELVVNIVKGIWLGRDLINTPASDLGPQEIEDAATHLAGCYNAKISTIVGKKLLDENMPMIHAVGRASPRDPRLIDLRWSPKGGRADAPSITLVGKGISFDTGGLDLKPASNMILMKKDMGGAASALALGQMIMGAGLDVRLRVLIAAAENSVDGSAFRPSDILKSRKGLTVEVGNTDAEGRLVLADALNYADEEKPDYLISLATLTGAARVALGVDLPAFFSTDDAFFDDVSVAGEALGDPVWRLPFWRDYDRTLDSPVADVCNISSGPFGGAITAALFLKRFVTNARTYAHVDMYGWRPASQPLGPKGGEAHVARALFETFRKISGS